jgi:hypothetical protein
MNDIQHLIYWEECADKPFGTLPVYQRDGVAPEPREGFGRIDMPAGRIRDKCEKNGATRETKLKCYCMEFE